MAHQLGFRVGEDGKTLLDPVCGLPMSFETTVHFPVRFLEESMRLLQKIFIFLAVFSGLFFALRTYEAFNENMLLADIADLGGVPWLYSVVGIIFSVLAAFIIQNEWQQWSNLVSAVRGEVEGLEQLWRCAQHLPDETRVSLCERIHHYLTLITTKGLDQISRHEHTALDHVFMSICDAVYGMLEQPRLKVALDTMLANIIAHRGRRLLYSFPATPGILKNTLGLATALVIGLSLFIGVQSIWLDYIFTISIALLAYVVYLVVDDLDNPLRPGLWQITPHDYHELLCRLEATPPTVGVS
jgi:hypothetical protein